MMITSKFCVGMQSALSSQKQTKILYQYVIMLILDTSDLLLLVFMGECVIRVKSIQAASEFALFIFTFQPLSSHI